MSHHVSKRRTRTPPPSPLSRARERGKPRQSLSAGPLPSVVARERRRKPRSPQRWSWGGVYGREKVSRRTSPPAPSHVGEGWPKLLSLRGRGWGGVRPGAAPATAARAKRSGAPDVILLTAVAGLLVIGLAMVYSASQLVVPGDPGYWVRRQALWAAIGLVALAVTARVDYHVWRRLFWGRASLAGMALAVILLALVLKLGHTVYGAQRWLHLGLFSFQPSEFAKLALALYIADWLARKGDEVRSFLYGLVPFALVTGLVLALVLMQNDLGSAVILACLAVVMFFVAGASLFQLVPTLALGGGLFALFVAHSSFRLARLDAFLHPLPPGCADAASYQVCQGLIALGSGGVFGRGLGASVQKAGYLPNPFTDSVFAVLGEELGLLGCAVVLALFAVLAYRGLRAGRRAPDLYGALLACGITCWLLVQAVLNIGSVASALPFTGVPLPFVSYGGSSLVVALAGVGILLNIAGQAKTPETAGG